MSAESAKTFLEKMRTDDDFAKSVTDAATKKERSDFVKAAGFDFTTEEFNEEVGALSDDDLDGVAGGVARGGRNIGKISLSARFSSNVISKGGLSTDCQNDGNESVCVCG
jgi:predicted ribosomally synthesized peptide with nif11-like leader|tara:strand:+ start:432 stop:761 length:330 start_codon:yes stop_codon:yes gene_type:complete